MVPRLLLCALIVATCCAPLSPQTMVDRTAAGATLAASSGARETRDFPCQVNAIKPFLNIGLRLQTGYVFRVPVASARSLTILLAVTAEGAASPAYLTDHVALRPSEAVRYYESGGAFFVGPGSYHVKWLLFDDAGHSCVRQWQVDAEFTGKTKLAIPPKTVADIGSAAVLPPGRTAPNRRLTILLDAAPVSESSAHDPLDDAAMAGIRGGGGRGAGRGVGSLTLPPPFAPDRSGARSIGSRDQVVLLGALSALLEQLPASEVRLVAFNLAYQRQLYRNDAFTLSAFSEVAHAVGGIDEAGVDYRILQNRTGHVELLAALMNREIRANPSSDVVVFLGPPERFHDAFPDGKLDPLRGASPQFFFLRYELSHPAQYSGLNSAEVGGGDISDSVQSIARSGGAAMSAPPGGSPDTLSRAIKKLHGKTIAFETPAQFAKAVSVIDRRSRAR